MSLEILKQAPSWEDLPVDLTIDIFSRLTVEQLFRCRGVCKLWCNFIDSPYFADFYTSNTIIKASVKQSQLFLLITHPYSYTIRHPYFNDAKIRIFNGTKTMNFNVREEEPLVEIVNARSFDFNSLGCGFFLFVKDDNLGEVFLFNPLRRELLMLPKARVPDIVKHPCGSYGMGFDSTTKTYKLIHLYIKKSESEDFALATEVLVLGTGKWREIPAHPSIPIRRDPISAHGDVHWLAGKCNGFILSFDCKKENFRLSPHPVKTNPVKTKSILLFEYRESLAIADLSSDTNMVVWLMKDYDRKEWTIEFKISTQVWLKHQYAHTRFKEWEPNYIRIHGAWKDGIILSHLDDFFMYYIPQTDCLKFLSKVDCQCVGLVFNYTGNLVSLKNFGNLVAKERGKQNCIDLCHHLG